MKRTAIITTFATVALLVVAAAPASAQLLFLEAVDSGFYTWEGKHSQTIENYIAGDAASAGVAEYRDFFVFDLSAVPGPAIRAALSLYNPSDPPDPGNGFVSPDPSETFEVHEVTTDIATLTAGGSGLVAVFDDLGDGLVYGAVDMAVEDNGRAVVFGLNQDAVDGINAAIGGQWAIGGAVTTLNGTPVQAVFGFTSGAMSKQLVLDLGGTIFWDHFETGTTDAWGTVSP